MVLAQYTFPVVIATSTRFTMSVAVATAVATAVVTAMVRGSDSDCGKCVGRCIHPNQCHCVKAAFRGSAKFPANSGFATRAAITSAAAAAAAAAVGGGDGRRQEVLVLVATTVVIMLVDPMDSPSGLLRLPQLTFE